MAELNQYLAELGRLAQSQYAASIDGIATQNVPALRALIDKDPALDALEAQIHTKAFEVIAMRAPAA
ncbi:MAG: PhoU domain-containing protein, partial [Candidatus Puniceispirillum sp.]